MVRSYIQPIEARKSKRFKVFMRRCIYCGVIFRTKAKQGKVCTECKIKNKFKK